MYCIVCIELIKGFAVGGAIMKLVYRGASWMTAELFVVDL